MPSSHLLMVLLGFRSNWDFSLLCWKFKPRCVQDHMRFDHAKGTCVEGNVLTVCECFPWCVCVCVRVRACVRACVRVCLSVSIWMFVCVCGVVCDVSVERVCVFVRQKMEVASAQSKQQLRLTWANFTFFQFSARWRNEKYLRLLINFPRHAPN